MVENGNVICDDYQEQCFIERMQRSRQHTRQEMGEEKRRVPDVVTISLINDQAI